ncbi:ralA-binding protein 1 [Phlebotomus papatasi]|uniref:ralA-binding protein 1 n=1 Tax=Phlebotomus papatasi TaxID=29031 RepID=UPI00248396A0|nr:ralA-binding protein 1 [Phlebotomus papatasi]
MEFESPDVEKEFPGLFASQMRGAPEAEPDDEARGRRRDRKERKDKGYAALSGESSSPEKDTKSPTRSGKKKPFKFKKERRDKSRPRPPLPVFGVDLELAARRSPCLDGVTLPLPMRHALDCLRTHSDGRQSPTPAQRSAVADLRAAYDARRLDAPQGLCPTVAWELLRLFLASLPHPLLPTAMAQQLTAAPTASAVEALPEVQRTALAWLVCHLDVLEAKHCPLATLTAAARIPSRLLSRLHSQSSDFFPWCHPEVHVAPLVAAGTATPPLPDHPAEVAAELGRQERLLALIHSDMSEGLVCEQREEQLWCVQRIVTHLKRRLRLGRLQWNSEASMYLPHATHPEADELIKLQVEHKHLLQLSERLHQRLTELTENTIQMAGEESSIGPAAGQTVTEEDTQVEAIVAENLKLMATASNLAEKIQQITMENLQLQVEVTIEQEALTRDTE